ncbi:nitrate ABC transporter substrate-binding protein [Pseudomonas sp. A46]|jgi:NitT/TauT family transport system substrate-binding protein|uniref:ABC transporter substrate-binding protein n=1 Tax=Metapseudomonas furukawaii TaxID=1149133 RepID=UPI000B49BD92|nr:MULTISPECIES: ABC transporter substrate-binding protein [Pseudomonas]OWJ89591.1 nitrate ABC transporter substrate-binding protein [Pseudomonas sp. A46]WAG80527.1 ABC transporter substrate-binding protein [Pseudomonas furukawaii]
MFKNLIHATFFCAALGAGLSVQAAPKEVTYLLPAPPNSPAFAPWIIAQQKGYYAQQGLKVTFVAGKGGVDVAKQIGAGNALVGGAIGDTPIIVRANGVPVKAVAVLGASGVTMIATDEQAGIGSIKDLKGKTLTVMSYSDTTYYALLASMRKAGLSKTDVEVQAAGPSGVWQLFSAGKSQAMAGVPDWVVNAEDAGLKVKLMPRSEVFESMAQAILASEEAIEKQPEVVGGVVKATLMGMRDIIADPKQAAATFAEAVPSYKGKEASLERVLRLYVEHVYANQQPLGHIDPARLDTVRKFYVSEGIVGRETPLDELYTNRFVDADDVAAKQ